MVVEAASVVDRVHGKVRLIKLILKAREDTHSSNVFDIMSWSEKRDACSIII
jgi:hypothetical protein